VRHLGLSFLFFFFSLLAPPKESRHQAGFVLGRSPCDGAQDEPICVCGIALHVLCVCFVRVHYFLCASCSRLLVVTGALGGLGGTSISSCSTILGGMAPKFDLTTADTPALRDRVRQLTSALVKQKEQIEKLRGTEHQLAGDKEKLERQVRNMQEEAAMSREMRADLQGEVARLQRALEHQTAEAEMLRTEVEASAAAPHGAGLPDSAAATANGELVSQLRKAAEDAEARVALLESEMVRHRDEATSLSEELEALRDAYDMDRRRWADRRPPPAGMSSAEVPAAIPGNGNAEAAPDSGSEMLPAAHTDAGGEKGETFTLPQEGMAEHAGWDATGHKEDSENGTAGEAQGQAGRAGSDAPLEAGQAGNVHSGDGTAGGGQGAHATAANGAAPARAGESEGWIDGEVERLMDKVAASRRRCRELEASVASLQQQVAHEQRARVREQEAHEAERGDASARHAAVAASLESAQKAYQQAQRYIKELEAQRDEIERDRALLRSSLKDHNEKGDQVPGECVASVLLVCC